MMQKKLLVAATLVVAAHAAMAQPETRVQMASGVGASLTTATVKAAGTVVAIDAPTRTVSLKNKQGKITDVQVGDAVRNFNQIHVGDVVTAEYTEALSVSMTRQTGMRSSIEREMESRAAPGTNSSGMVGREVTVTADVAALNTRTGMVTLRGPNGRTVDVHVADPKQLKGIRRGDQVQAVYIEAFAVSITPKSAR